MKKNNSLFDDLEMKPTFLEKSWWKIQNFFENWIYPGYYFRNFFFHRYDRINLPMFKSYEYIDISLKMKFAIFELIKEFIEKENPEKYICWYKDETGEDLGHKYGEGNQKVLFQNLKGKYIMDIIKDIYNFYTKVLPELEKEKDYLLNIWCKYINNGHYIEDENDEDLLEWIKEDSNYSMKDLEKENLNWDVILKYIEKKENFFQEDLIYSKYHDLEKEIENKTQYYLHLAIEVREYLWT